MRRFSKPPSATAKSRAEKDEVSTPNDARKYRVGGSIFIIIVALVAGGLYYQSRHHQVAGAAGAAGDNHGGVATPGLTATPKNHACQPGKVSDKLVPSCGAWWGAYVSADNYGGDNAKALAAFEGASGRQIDIVHRYHTWNESFPDSAEKSAAAGGRMLYLSWESQTDGQSGQQGVSWRDVAAGKYDAVIDRVAARLKELQTKVFLDFDQEPDDRVYAGKDVDFASTYRHIHDRFAEKGVTNVVWVWTVSGWEGVYFRYADLYPGDNYVDWIGYEPYNWYVCHGIDWQMPMDIFKPFYQWVQVGEHRNKPIIVSEYGSFENTSGDPQSKGSWMRAVPAALKELPNIKAAVYFNKDYSGCLRASIDTSADSTRGFADAGHDPYVNQRHAP
jgi:beta-mannanase